MIKIMKFALLSLFFLAGINFDVQAQYIVTPTTINQVAVEIITDHPHLVNISQSQLAGHLSTVVDPTIYCPSCPNTNLVVQENAPNTLILNWLPVASADYYEIRYLNLQTGFSNAIVEPGSSLTLSGLPAGPYALSIVTYNTSSSGPQVSRGNIIIEETPILFPDINNDDCDCVNAYESGSLVDNILTWDPILEFRYEFNLIFEDDINRKISMSTIPVDGFGFPIKFEIQCQENIEFKGSNTFSAIVDGEEIMAYFTYDDAYRVEFFTEDSYLVTLNRCDKPGLEFRLAETEKSETPIIIYPNPAKDKLWINSSNNSEELHSMTIYNNIGRKIIQRNLISTKELLSIDFLPAGMYIIEIKTNDKITTQSFVKVN